MIRDVREDQHGTPTGYANGCRCEPCRRARREYVSTHAVSPETVDAVFAAIAQEADLDGLCTATSERLGEIAGMSHVSANWAVHHLADSGRVRLGERVGRGGVYEIFLPEEDS